MHPVIKIASAAIVTLLVLRPPFRRWLWWRIARNEALRSRTGRALCPACARRLPTRRHFCFWCGAPVSGYAATGPVEYIAAQGEMYRRSCARPSLIAVLGLWLLCMPSFFIVAAALIDSHGQLAPESLAWLPVSILPAAIALKATLRYFSTVHAASAGNA